MSQVLRLERPWPVELGPIELFSGGRRIGGFVTRIHPDGAFDVVLGAEAKRRTEAWNEPARLVAIHAPVSAPRALTVVPSLPPPPPKKRDTTLRISRPLTVPQCSKVSRPRSLVDAVLEQRQAEEMIRPPEVIPDEANADRICIGCGRWMRRAYASGHCNTNEACRAAGQRVYQREANRRKRGKSDTTTNCIVCGGLTIHSVTGICTRTDECWRANMRAHSALKRQRRRSRESGAHRRPSCEDGAP